MKKFILWLCLIVTGMSLVAQNNVIVAESEATFVIENLGVDVEGRIRGMQGEVRLDQDSSFIDVALEVKAIRTGIRMRDQHLKEDRFLDQKQFPQLTFQSQKISKKADVYVALGQLTIKGVTREIEVSFQMQGELHIGSFSINRKDFNVDNDDFITRGIADAVNISVYIKIDPNL